MMRVLSAFLATSTFCSAAYASVIGIASLTGDFEMVSAPASVERQVFESSSAMRVFLEREIPVPGTVPINALAAGVYNAYADFVDVNITPAGAIRSYFIHFDPVGTARARLEGSITFDAAILGVIGRSLTMQNTDNTLGVPGTAYPGNRFNRELEFQPRGNYDYFQIQPDGRTIFVRAECTTDVDQIRVITAIPEPAGFPAALFAATAAFGTGRRRLSASKAADQGRGCRPRLLHHLCQHLHRHG